MNEDDIYRTSTQFRFWTYTERTLADLRSKSNTVASARVRDAISRSRGAENGTSDALNVDCLSVDEEQKIIRAYCVKAMEISDLVKFPKAVKATAVQFLKRFYLSTSPMTYHPKEIMLSAVFLATKVENINMSVSDFANSISKITSEDVLAPEFLLTQGLRFTFDVRHPFRGLEGGIMELNQMARGEYQASAGSLWTSESVKTSILNAPGQSRTSGPATAEQFADRIKKAHNKAGEILTKGALLTDAYFLYTPSQIWMSALLAADKPLAETYLHIVLSGKSGPSTEPSAFELRVKGLLEQCAALMTRPSSWGLDEAEETELKRIGKKLYKCQNPEKLDIASTNRAIKEGLHGGANDGDDEKVVKKRKLERERAAKAGEDLFGAPLKK